MNERFEELLPWYANGSMGAEDRAWVDTYLEQHPEARSELDWYRSLQRAYRKTPRPCRQPSAWHAPCA